VKVGSIIGLNITCDYWLISM